jgi:hypothetical protein
VRGPSGKTIQAKSWLSSIEDKYIPHKGEVMAQDNPNDTTRVEEPQSAVQVPDGATPTEQSVEPSANALGATPNLVDGAANTEAPSTDDAEDEIPDAESEEDEDTGDTASAPELASNTNDGAISQPPNAPSAKSEEETDDRSGIEKQPYDCAPHHAA